MRYMLAATVLAAALGLAPAAQADRLLYRLGPSNQGQNQTAQILGGLAALGALGYVVKELNEDDDDDRRRVHDRRRDRDEWRHHDRRSDRHDWHGRDRRYDRDGWRDRRWHDRDRRWRRAAVLPGDCLHRVHDRRGPDRVFGARCLDRSGVELRHLPRDCRSDVLVRGRYHAAYSARCLQHRGWRVAQYR